MVDDHTARLMLTSSLFFVDPTRNCSHKCVIEDNATKNRSEIEPHSWNLTAVQGAGKKMNNELAINQHKNAKTDVLKQDILVQIQESQWHTQRAHRNVTQCNDDTKTIEWCFETHWIRC